MPCCEISDYAQMSKTIIAVRHFELGGCKSLKTAVSYRAQTAEHGTFRRNLGQLIFRCAKSFSGAQKSLQARLRCALGAGIKVRAAGQSA